MPTRSARRFTTRELALAIQRKRCPTTRVLTGNHCPAKLKVLDVTRTPAGRIRDCEYPPVVLAALAEIGGRARAREVIERVARMLPLEDIDRERQGPRSHIRYVYATHRARQRLVATGMLKPFQVSERGWWELTAKGRKRE